MHITVGCVLAELLAQTGYENGTLDCCVPTAAATRPAAARLTVNLKTLHKPRVKEISERVAHNLNVFLTFFIFFLCWPSPRKSIQWLRALHFVIVVLHVVLVKQNFEQQNFCFVIIN